MGVAALKKLRAEQFGADSGAEANPTTVEEAVDALVNCSQSPLHTGMDSSSEKDEEELDPDHQEPSLAPGTHSVSTTLTTTPVPPDFTSLMNKLNDLALSFADFRTESAKREATYLKQIKSLNVKVDSLEKALHSVEKTVATSEGKISAKLSSVLPVRTRAVVETACESSDKSTKEPVETFASRVRNNRPQAPASTSTFTASPNNRPQAPASTSTFTASNGSGQIEESNQAANVPDKVEDRTKQWEQAQGRHVRRRTSSSSSTNGPKNSGQHLRGSPKTKRVVFYLGGIADDCSAEQIKAYCEERHVRVSNCRLLPSKRFRSVAARLCVAATDAEEHNILHESFWPADISIRPWMFEGADRSENLHARPGSSEASEGSGEDASKNSTNPRLLTQ